MVQRLALAVSIAIWCAILPAAAQQPPARLALLIANQGYSRDVGPLRNPHTDVEIVGAALRAIGFDVSAPVKEAKRAQILTSVRQFAARLAVAGPGAIGFVYYSGHGAAETDNATNYLIPIDAPDPASPTFWDEALKLDDVLRLLQTAREASKFVVFDACRNELATPEKGSIKGFVPIAEQAGMFIAYATAAGRTASDRGTRGGPYSNALAAEIVKSGVHHLDLFQNVKEAVAVATGGAQHPWESNGLSRRVYLAGTAAAAAAVVAPPAQPAPAASARLSEAAEAWTLTKDNADPAVLAAFVRRFGDTFYGDLARSRLDALAAERRRQAELQKEADDKKAAQPVATVLSPAAQKLLNQSVQAQLERVGCGPGPIDGIWGDGARKALAQYNSQAGTSLDVATATEATLAALQQHKGRACPLACDDNAVERNGRCVAKEQPNREQRRTQPVRERPEAKAPSAQPTGSGRCDRWRSCVRAMPTRDSYNIYSRATVLACGEPPAGCSR